MGFVVGVLYKSLESHENPKSLSLDDLTAEMFKELDLDGDKKITKKEFTDVLSSDKDMTSSVIICGKLLRIFT